MKYVGRTILTITIFCVCASLLMAEEYDTHEKRLLLLGWNVESGGNSAAAIAKQLADFEGYDLIGLCEVRLQNAERYKDAVAEGEGAHGKLSTFDYRISESGGADRQMIIWDTERLILVSNAVEETSMQYGNYRAPFWVRFWFKDTEEEFIFMMNHLARGNANIRQSQAEDLDQWVQSQNIPVIAMGDYNFDYNIDEGTGNDAMNIFLSPGNFKWIRPIQIEKTNLHPKYNGVLDFLFVAQQPDNWTVTSGILSANFKYPDDDNTSDHRPISGTVYIKVSE